MCDDLHNLVADLCFTNAIKFLGQGPSLNFPITNPQAKPFARFLAPLKEASVPG